MIQDYSGIKEESEPKVSKKSNLPLILIIIILIIIIAILAIVIYLLIYFRNYAEDQSNKDETNIDKAPLIGIVGKRIPDESGESIETMDYTQIHYILAVEKSGGIPLTLPVLQNFNSEVIKRQVEAVDALLIQGGIDVSPSLYNEEPMPEIGLTDLQTDNYQVEVIKQAVERKIPIFGICRGIQILNVAFGGNLYQDLKHDGLDSKSHYQSYNDTCIYKHTIKVEKNSTLGKIFPNNETLYVNSFHHQAIKNLAKGFVVDAKSDDGIIEAIHWDNEDQWIFAVQFHPEQHITCNNDFLPLFKELVSQARTYKKNHK